MTFGVEKIESAIAGVEALSDPSARSTARAAVKAVVDFHAEAIRRLWGRIGETEGERLLSLADDELVASLLLLHGLHPVPLAARVRQALESLQATWDGGGRVELISVNEAAVELWVDGGDALRRAALSAVTEAAPDVQHVEVVTREPQLIPVASLLAKRRPGHSRCELCGGTLSERHPHLVDLRRSMPVCACDACGVLFDANVGQYRRIVPKRVFLDGFRVSQEQWDALQIPVGLAFCFRSSTRGGKIIAAYPAPGGTIESEVSPSAWQSLTRDNAVLEDLEPDVIALVIDRLAPAPRHYLLSIDECYRLTGLVRSQWQGFAGGDATIRAVADFFASSPEQT